MTHSESYVARNLRHHMVRTQLLTRAITAKRVIDAMEKIPRHEFAPFTSLEQAYADSAYEIDCNQAISQPYIVGLMSQALDVEPHHRVLEVGTGSGYQTAILAELCQQVYSIERHPTLSQSAQKRLESLGYSNIHFEIGDGTQGLEKHAPYDRILVAAASPFQPDHLVSQLVYPGGVLVYPRAFSPKDQELLKLTRDNEAHVTQTSLGAVRFVPLISQATP